MAVIGYALLGLAFWVGVAGVVIGWPLTGPLVIVLGLLGIAGIAHRPRPFDWSRDGI